MYRPPLWLSIFGLSSILIILLTTSIIFLFSSQSQNYQNWVTFSDQYHHLTFKYPTKWEISSDPTLTTIYHPTFGKIDIGLENYQDPQSSFEFNANYWRDYYLGSSYVMGDGVTLESVQQLPYQLDTKTGLSNIINTRYENQPETSIWTYLPFSSSQLLYIRSYPNRTQDLVEINHILSTIKFSNLPLPTPTAVSHPPLQYLPLPNKTNWNRLINSEYSYSFEYPVNLFSAYSGSPKNCSVILQDNSSPGSVNDMPSIFGIQITIYPCANIDTTQTYNSFTTTPDTINKVMSIKYPGDSAILNKTKDFGTFTRQNDITIAGKTALVVQNDTVYEASKSTKHRLIYLMHGNLYYVISALIDNTTPYNSALLTQILSTFSFDNLTTTPNPKKSTSCKTGGCSGELCVDSTSEDRASICIYKMDYGCLKQSRCEPQPDGTCGWTQTAEYLSCISKVGVQ